MPTPIHGLTPRDFLPAFAAPQNRGVVWGCGETGQGVIAGTGTSTDVTRFNIGPELKRRIDTGNGASIEPFAFLKSSLTLGESDWRAPAGQNTVGGGILLSKPDRYKVRAAADFTESMNGAEEVATGKVSVSVPSNLSGF